MYTVCLQTLKHMQMTTSIGFISALRSAMNTVFSKILMLHLAEARRAVTSTKPLAYWYSLP